MHMVLKNELIKTSYLAAGFIPTRNLNIYHLENWRYISGENVWRRWICLYFMFFVPSKLSLYTIDYCRYALSGDGWGIFISGHSRNSNNNH